MGNILSSSSSSSPVGVGETLSSTATNELNLWDMILHLFKRYVISKVENDEFLCAYLLNTDHKLTFLRMGQRAITYEPLPSRVKYDGRYDPLTRNPEPVVRPKIEEYVESEEEEYSEEYTESEEESISDDYEDEEEYSMHPPTGEENESVMGIYAIYSKLNRNNVMT